MVSQRVTPPDIHPSCEVRVEFVDRGGKDRLLMPRRPEQRVEGDAAIDPAGGVARIERVGKRRQQVFGDADRVADQRQRLATDLLGKLDR